MISIRKALPISFAVQFYFISALSLLLVPLRWLLGWVIAAAVHELGHYIALRFCKCPVYGIRIGLSGAVMETGAMFPTTELLSAAAGPLFGASLLLLSKWFPVLAVCAFVQTVFNLSPVYPLDGGRVLRSVLMTFLSEVTAIHISNAVSMILCCIAFVLLFSVCFKLSMPLLPILVFVIVAFKCYRAKLSCKGEVSAVQ